MIKVSRRPRIGEIWEIPHSGKSLFYEVVGVIRLPGRRSATLPAIKIRNILTPDQPPITHRVRWLLQNGRKLGSPFQPVPAVF